MQIEQLDRVIATELSLPTATANQVRQHFPASVSHQISASGMDLRETVMLATSA